MFLLPRLVGEKAQIKIEELDDGRVAPPPSPIALRATTHGLASFDAGHSRSGLDQRTGTFVR